MLERICTTCGVQPAMPGRRPICRVCRQAYDRKWYEQNKNRVNPKRYVRNREKYKQMAEYLYEYLLEHPCVDCGESDPIVLEFDHLRDKKTEVVRMMNYSSGSLLQEIEKCDVRCANCHRRKTARESNHTRHLLSFHSGSRPIGRSPVLDTGHFASSSLASLTMGL